jgi:hypothetical protein
VELMGHWFEVMDTYKEKHLIPEKDYCKVFILFLFSPEAEESSFPCDWDSS